MSTGETNFWETVENNIVSDRDEDIVVTGLDAPPLEIDTWKDANLDPVLLRNIFHEKFDKPRKFQRRVIPVIMQGYDLKGHAEAGSGKTASFVIPIINTIISLETKLSSMLLVETQPQKKSATPYCIFIAPTWELAQQAIEGFERLALNTGMKAVLCIGGINIKKIINKARRGCDILCATPGKLLELIKENEIEFNRLKFLVFDEIDKCLEMGFGKNKCLQESTECKQHEGCMYHQIQRILQTSGFPSIEKRQTLVFSATFSAETQELVNKILLRKTNCMVTNKKLELPNLRIRHEFLEVSTKEKLDKLLEILKKDATDENEQTPKRSLVFVNFRPYVYKLVHFLQTNDIKADGIERHHYNRLKVLNNFRRKEFQVLVSSDLCGRGIDIKNLYQVINYDIPKDKITYIHRVGRVGRVLEGTATSLFDPLKNGEEAKYLAQVLQQAGAIIPECIIKSIDASRFSRT